jgi:hypothetical protein
MKRNTENCSLFCSLPEDLWKLLLLKFLDKLDTFILAYVSKNLCSMVHRHDESVFWLPSLFLPAFKYGYLNIIQWENKQNGPTLLKCIPEGGGESVAARYGHIHILEWLDENGIVTSSIDIIIGAVIGNQIDVLNWVYNRVSQEEAALYELAGISAQPARWSSIVRNHMDKIVITAAGDGNVLLLEWLKDHGFAYNGSATIQAMSKKNIPATEWLIKHGICPANILDIAANVSNVEL